MINLDRHFCDQCIFCNIIRKKESSVIVEKYKDYISFMDIYPPTFDNQITMPVVLVIPKNHYKSNVFEDMSKEKYIPFMNYIRRVARAIQRALNPDRVFLVFEGMEVDHVHAKLYAMYLNLYPLYLSTEKGFSNKLTKASRETLEELADKIRGQLS